MTGYSETILKYATDDSHAGQLEEADGTGEVGLAAGELGRKLAVRLTIQVEQDRVKAARYKVFGCGFTIAACAAITRLIEGQRLDEIALLDAAAVDQSLGGLPEERSYCADLAIEALQAALNSAKNNAVSVATSFEASEEAHGPLLTEDDFIYQVLSKSPARAGIEHEDRHVFACLLATAEKEPSPLHQALGLTRHELFKLFTELFPCLDFETLFSEPLLKTGSPPAINSDLLALLQTFVATENDNWKSLLANCLAQAIAARAAHPGHLWIAMGLFERPQLSAAIGRHLPALLAANSKKMRWKRFLFKQLCEESGGLLCKSPLCGDCSDYALCFAPEQE